MAQTFKTRRLLRSTILSGVAAAFVVPAYAQEDDDGADAADSDDRIVVTGSRIRQDTFNSPTPIQVLDTENARKLGITTITELLQRSTVASGQQIDATLNTNAGNSNATEAPPTSVPSPMRFAACPRAS